MRSAERTHLAFVVATKDRAEDLRRLLRNLSGQSVPPREVVIVDASRERDDAVAREFPGLGVRYRHHPRPSASAQRNIGVGMIGRETELVGFLDDDVVLAPGAVESMLRFWSSSPGDLGGCAFNLLNPPSAGGSRLKRSFLSRWLGLYSDAKGAVSPSGWHTMTGTVAETTFVDWLPSTAIVWRREVFEELRFDEFFDSYSYLEDVDFSYSARKRWRLAVLAEAGYWHHHSPSGRVSGYEFGKIEVRNRLYFVRKHGLSRARCYLGILVRLLMTVGAAARSGKSAFVARAAGNVAGLLRPAASTKP